MTKKVSKYEDFVNAFERLKEVLLLNSKDEIVRDASIQRFEFTFEAAWKLMQDINKTNTINEFGPMNSIRGAAKLGIIDDAEKWIEFFKARNLSAHTYFEPIAVEVYSKAKEFVVFAEKFRTKVKDFIDN